MDALQNYDFTAAASGAEFPIGAPGRLIYYYSGSAGGADNTILVRAGNTGAKFLLKPGQSYKLPAEAKEIDTWYISNYSRTAPIIGVLQIGDGDFKDNRISGSVETIDGGKARTLANMSFLGGQGLAAPGAGVNAMLELWNPANSGKNVIVETVYCSSLIAGYFILKIHNAALATAGSLIYPKLASAAAVTSTALLKSGTSGTPPGNTLFGLNNVANTQASITLKEPIVIAPGNGLLIHGAANQDISPYFEFFEENQ